MAIEFDPFNGIELAARLSNNLTMFGIHCDLYCCFFHLIDERLWLCVQALQSITQSHSVASRHCRMFHDATNKGISNLRTHILNWMNDDNDKDKNDTEKR